MAFLAEDDGGIGGIEGGGIDCNPPGIVEQESSSSGDRSGLGGEGAGDVVRVGKAGVGGIMKCKGEWCSGDSGGEYIGETGDGDGVALDGDGVLGGWNSRSSVGEILTGEIFFVGDVGKVFGFLLIGGEICFGDLRGDDLRGDLETLAGLGMATGGGLGLVGTSLTRGEWGLVSFSCFSLGGDFLCRGGEGGGGAALRAGIVIGEGTLLTGNSVGGEGDASFSGSLCNTGGPSSSSFIPPSVSVMFDDAVAAFPFCGFIFLTELLLFLPLPPDFPPTTLPPTTDTVTSFSTAVPPGSVSSAPGSSTWSSDSYLKSSLVSPRDAFPGSDLAESSPDLDGSAGGIGLNLGDRGI